MCIKRNLEKGLEEKTDKKKQKKQNKKKTKRKTEFLIQNSIKKYPWHYSHEYDIIIK